MRNAVVWLVLLSLVAIASCRSVGQAVAPTATTAPLVSHATPPSTRAARGPSASSTATATEAAATPTRSTAPPTDTPAMTSETPVPTTSSPGASLDLQAIAFADTQHGWVAGAGIILATTDGGQTWTRQYAGPGTIRQLDFVSATDGWALGDDALLHTSDGGRTWLPVGEPPVPLTRVDFETATVGWGTTAGAGLGQGPLATRDASKDLLYVTHDAGRTWTLQSTPIPVGGMCFVDAERGWVVNASVAAAPALLATADGGRTWHAVSPPPVFPPATPTPNGEQAPFRQTLRCVQPNVLWDLADLGPIGAGGGDSYVLARSPDGGQHWQGVAQHIIHVPSLAAVPPGPGKNDGAFDAVDATTAYLTGACGIGCGPPEGTTALGRTTDGGRTWRNFPAIPGLPATFAAPAFPTPTQGWLLVRWNVPPPAGSTVSPARSAILATRDGGMSWTLQYPRPPSSPLDVLAFANPNNGCIGGRLVVSCTSDGGRTWSTTSPGMVEVVQLQLVDARTGWAVAGGILESKLVPSANERAFYRVGPPDTLLGTTDGGYHWEYLTYLPGLRSVDFVDHVHGWAVTDDGLLSTNDGGRNWSPQTASLGPSTASRYVDAGPSSLLLSFASQRLGWAVGQGNHVLHTTDGGNTWNDEWTPPYGASWTSGPAQIRFVDARRGWLLLTMGQGCASQEPYALYRTDDSGSQWSLRLVGPGACGRAGEPGYPANPTYGLPGYPAELSVLGPDDAWLAVFNPAASRLDLESTADGGRNWKQLGSISGYFDRVSMAFVSSTQGWLVAGRRVPSTTRNVSQVLHTMDGGQTWTEISVTR